MHLAVTCPNWEYKDFPSHEELLIARSRDALRRTRSPQSVSARINGMKNTRAIHVHFFRDLTPPGFEYYSGHYRGETGYFCLVRYEVKIEGNPLVGYPAREVPLSMKQFENDIDTFFKECDLLWPINELIFTKHEKIVRTVAISVTLFSYFLQIHPYANGNGHISRHLLINALARYQIFLSKWPVHPRPQDPPYSELIKQYQQGNHPPLIRFVLSCI
jgi:hypothetical protein